MDEFTNYPGMYTGADIDDAVGKVKGGFSLADVGGSNPNLFDNPRFTVNQRGVTSFTANGTSTIFVDRWEFSGIGTITHNADKSVTITTNAANFGAFGQNVGHRVAGQKLTFSILLDDGEIYSLVGDMPLGSGLNVYYLTINGANWQVLFRSDGTTYWSVSLRNNSVATITIKAAKLELGSVQTLAHLGNGAWVLTDPIPDEGIELLKCIQSTATASDGYANKTVLHTGNKPSGSYTGNGSAAQRQIAVGGIGQCVVVFSGDGEMCLVTPAGAYYPNGNSMAFTRDIACSDGTLYVTSSTIINTNGNTYYYQVL